jgi:hypothetical protein
MSEQLYFFKFDQEKASSKLLTEINSDEGFTYKQYLTSCIGDGFEPIKFEKVNHKVKSDIYEISQQELMSLYLWFIKKYDYNYEKVEEEEMINCGLVLFDAIEEKSVVRRFYIGLQDDYPQIAHLSSGRHSIQRYKNFWNYTIGYCGGLRALLFKNGLSENDGPFESENLVYIANEISQVKLNDNRVYQLVKDHLDKIEEELLNIEPTEELDVANYTNRIADFYDCLIDQKPFIFDDNRDIFLLHSY